MGTTLLRVSLLVYKVKSISALNELDFKPIKRLKVFLPINPMFCFKYNPFILSLYYLLIFEANKNLGIYLGIKTD